MAEKLNHIWFPLSFEKIDLPKTNSEKLEVLSSFQLTKGSGPFWSHPVIDKGRLFVRHGDYLAVYSLKSK